MTIGERIRKSREASGKSVIEVANVLGKARSTIYRYEMDEVKNIPVTIVEPLATILGVTPAYLMGWVEKPDQRYLSTDDVNSVGVDSTLGERIYMVISNEYGSIEDFHIITGYPIEIIRCFCDNTTYPHPDECMNLAHIMNINPLWLLGFPYQPIERTPLQVAMYSLFLLHYEEASKKNREIVCKILDCDYIETPQDSAPASQSPDD